jgi:O-antigen/teichoic acid export membrane protein
MQLLSYRLDLFVLSALASRSAVGVYSIAVSVTALGWLLPDALQTVLFPRVASLDAATDAGRMTARVSDASAARAIRHTVLIVVPTALAVAALLLLVPVLYGSGFQQSITLGFILIPGVAALGIAKVISAVLSGRGSPRFSVYTAAITTPISLALYLILIPQFHAIGAAIASTISYVVTIGLSVVFLRKVTVVPLREALLPSRSDIADYVDAFRIIRARMGR